MDSEAGPLYRIFTAVRHLGQHEEVQPISTVRASTWNRDQKAKRNAKNKAARTARRNNR